MLVSRPETRAHLLAVETVHDFGGDREGLKRFHGTYWLHLVARLLETVFPILEIRDAVDSKRAVRDWYATH